MRLFGKAYKFGDNINTDYIISGKRKFKTIDMKELAKFIMEDIAPGFYSKIKPGDFIVAGRNFGCGSSREQAPQVIKSANIGAVLAKSFARIFFRNAVNIGLPVIECDTDKIDANDELEIDLNRGRIHNITKDIDIEIKPLPSVMIKILSDGGLVEHFKKYGTFHFE